MFEMFTHVVLVLGLTFNPMVYSVSYSACRFALTNAALNYHCVFLGLHSFLSLFLIVNKNVTLHICCLPTETL